MKADFEYFRRMRDTDPTYTARAAVRKWLSEHPEDAVELAELAWSNIDGYGRPMTHEELKRCLGYWDPIQFVLAGYASEHLNGSDPYLELVGDHFRSLSRAEYIDACMDFMLDEGCEAILDEDIEAPRELERIIALWNGTSNNFRPRCAGGCKGCGKCGASRRRPAKKAAGKPSNAKPRNAKASLNRKPSQARRR